MGYEFWLSAEASRDLLGSERRIRQRMEQTLLQLSTAPFSPPDFEERSSAGRIYCVKMLRRHRCHLLG
jgi:hypothetical protein